MNKIVKIGFNVDIEGNLEFFVVRNDDYSEHTDKNVEGLEEVYQSLVEKSYTVKSKEELELEKLVEQNKKMVSLVIESTTDEQKLEMIDIFDDWSGDGVEYKEGNYVDYDGKLYRILQNHTSQASWTPESAPSLFTQINRKGEISEFGKMADGSERILSTNPYKLGEECIWNGYIYQWILDNVGGVWSPADYPQGWEQERPVA